MYVYLAVQYENIFFVPVKKVQNRSSDLIGLLFKSRPEILQAITSLSPLILDIACPYTGRHKKTGTFENPNKN
jgi:hypothetical protein